MTRRILLALVALNAALLVTLAARLTSDNTAHAQAQAPRRPSDYILIPGEVSGGTGAVVYMLDTGNGLLGAMTYDDSRRELNAMAPIDLARVFDGGQPQAPRGTQVAPGARGAGR